MADPGNLTARPQPAARPINGYTREYWTNELEVRYDHILEETSRDRFVSGWLEKKNGKQVDVLRHIFGIPAIAGRLRDKKNDICTEDDELLSYVLVQEFAKSKSRLATIGLAKKFLPPDVLEMCRKGDESDDEFDTLALCFALYHRDAQHLRALLHIDRIHKTGFARMKMKGGQRKLPQPLASFLTATVVEDILKEFDKSKADGRISDFKNIMVEGDNVLVFVRRCERPSLIMQGHDILHGFRPEWIVLVFNDGAKKVNISSLSVEDSLEIANRIASAYYSADCEYENDSAIVYDAQLRNFLACLKKDEEPALTIVELVLGNSPLATACALRLSHSDATSIGPSILQFERQVGQVTTFVDAIESIKVMFKKKRVSLIFEKHEGADDEYAVRYSDHRLNPLERIEFESYMADVHAIQVLSTEKRFKQAA